MFGEWLGQDAQVQIPYVDPGGQYGFNTYDISPGAYNWAAQFGNQMGSQASGSFQPFAQQSNAGPGAVPGFQLGQGYPCSADWIKKYQARAGSYPSFCGPQQPQPILPLPQPIPGPPSPPVPVPRRPPVRRWPARRPRRAPTGEICPIRGYVSRQIPGVAEYQNFRCTPGQSVRIDRGLAAAGAAGAYARAGMPAATSGTAFHSSLLDGLGYLGADSLGIGIDDSTLLLIGGVALLAMTLLRRSGRRRKGVYFDRHIYRG